MARKTSGNVAHAYDYLATWNHTYVNADMCQDLNPDEPLYPGLPTRPPAPSPSPLTRTASRRAARSPPQPMSCRRPTASSSCTAETSPATSAITHTIDPAEAGSDYGVITINFNVTDADGRVMLLFGGHLAAGLGPRGWGPLLGAAAISGGPYHIRLIGIDGESAGNRDNQIMSNAITPLAAAAGHHQDGRCRPR